jgi:hypothetical protein
VTVPFGVGIITRNRRDCCLQVLDAVETHTTTPHRTVVGVDHSDDDTTAALTDRGVRVVEPAGRGVPANRNAVLAGLDGCGIVALFEDDHLPTVRGWERPYIQALTTGPASVLLALDDRHGDVAATSADGTVQWRTLMSCQLIVLTRHVLDTVGGWNPAFGDRYGLDDGEYLARCVHAGLTGTRRLVYPTLTAAATLTADIVAPPSSDGKTFEERYAESRLNLPLLQAAADGFTGRIPLPAPV